MDYKELKVTYGEGRYRIDICSVVTSEGISCTVMGGEKAHVGGTSLSMPRTSLAGEGLSCDTWVTPVPGHKDAGLAVKVSEMICTQTGLVTAVVAGVHIDKAQEYEIKLLVQNTLEAAQIIINQINC